jgi:multidrug resistance efflux pump
MFAKYTLFLMATMGLVYSGLKVWQERQTEPPSPPMISPPEHPRAAGVISGAGLVEARTENIPLGVEIPGVVREVYVKQGDMVRAGDPLFRVDDRDLTALLREREAAQRVARAQLHKLRAGPRAEEVVPLRAAVAAAAARLNDADAARSRTECLFSRHMVAPSEFDKDRFAQETAKANLAQAKAELDHLLAGSWCEDIEVARAQLELAEAQVRSVETSLERLTVRAPLDGQVLRVNVRPGQLAALAWKEPMIVLGDVLQLNVRVDIDENDLPYFAKDAEAIATLKGRPGARFPLQFISVQPYVIPKQNLTGASAERVDTRVLQVIYRLPNDRPIEVYVGQQMDVYLRAAETPQGIALDVADNLAP